MNNNNNNVVNNSNETIIPVVPITGDVEESNNQSTVQVENKEKSDDVKLIMPSVKLPEMRNEVSPELDNNSSSVKELNLESSNPFDIGVNAPINTSVSVNSNTGSSVNTVPVNSSSNNKVEEDINIPQSSNVGDSGEVISFNTYLVNMLLFSIPIIGLIILVKKISSKDNKSISNFAKAYLLYGVIIVMISFILSFSLIGMR